MSRAVTRGGLTTAAVGLVLMGCAPGITGGIARADAPPVPFPECRANVYEFAGESTFNALGITDALAAEPPSPDRPAMIWITRDRLPFDAGPVGGAVEGTRMMCFEFPDGSGGSQWPVDDAWRLPSASTGDSTGGVMPPSWLLVGIAGLAAVGVSAMAFRRRA